MIRLLIFTTYVYCNMPQAKASVCSAFDRMIMSVQELSNVAEWQQPQAGMFIWVHLLAGVADVDDIAAELVQQNVMVLPGMHYAVLLFNV